MAITFVGAVKSFRSDSEGESVIAFTVPKSHKAKVAQVSDLTEQVLYITVFQDGELEGAQDSSAF